jgi:uncharacterized protein YcbX
MAQNTGLITVSQINIYPIKSTGGVSLQKSEVQKIGLVQDRRRAVVSVEKNRIITARENQKLFGIHTQILQDQLLLTSPTSTFSLPLSPLDTEKVHVKLWAEEAHPGKRYSKEVDEWFSAQLGEDCFLIFMDENCHREFPKGMASGYEGLPGDTVSYADDYPLLIASEASLTDLNARLETPVTMNHFRPNIVLSGCEAFEEDTWTRFRIGECEFELAQQCPRCVMTTIDPQTGIKHKHEPLKTLASYRKTPAGGAPFGAQAVPRKLGVIQLGDVAERLT